MSTQSFKPPETMYVLTHSAREHLHDLRKDLPRGITAPDPRRIKPTANLCGQPRKDGTPCTNWAGHRTQHEGTGPCLRHDGGYMGKFNQKLYLDFVEQERLMGVYGNPVDIDPHTALLKEVQRTAGHVEWLRQIIDDIHEAHQQSGDNALDRTLVQPTPMGMTASVWIQMYNDERKHLLRACEVAIKAGVAEKAVQIAQDQARTLAMILKMFLLDERMNLTPEQRINAPTVIRELITSVPNQVNLQEALPVASYEEEPAPAPKKRAKK